MARGGFRGGYGGMNQANMMKQAQKMQQDFLRMQKELEEKEFTAKAGGGMVTAVVNGNREVTKIEIKPEAVDPDDVEMLEDLVLAAVNEALRQYEAASDATVNKIAGGMTRLNEEDLTFSWVNNAETHQMVVSGVCPPQLSGSETAPLTVGTVDSIDAARFAGFCYAALGHIHRAQRVGIDAVRYAGAPLCYHLDECGMQKSVTLVRVGKRGVEKIEQLPLTPRRAMRHLTGPLARLTARPTDTEDYIWATLTDPTPLPDAMAQLRAAYPNAMRLDYLPQGEVAHPLDMTQAMRGKPFVELFQDFFTKMNGRPLTVEETVAVKRLREEASKSE